MARACIAFFIAAANLLEPVLAVGGIAACTGPRSARELISVLWKGVEYDSLVRPNAAAALAANATADSAEPDPVEVMLRFDALDYVDEHGGKVDVLVSRKTYWKDTRLSFKGAASGGCLGDSLELPGPPPFWKPDLYYMNLVHEGQVVGEYHRVHHDGSVKWHLRHRLKLACAMSRARMPYDQQHCRTRISTFAGTASDVSLHLKGEGVSGAWKERELGGSTEWTVTGTFAQVFDYKAIGDDDTALDFVIDFQRDSMFYLWYTMIPAIMVVVMSYSSFYVPRVAVPARGGLTSVSFLTLSTMVAGVQAGLPKTMGEGIMLLRMLVASQWFCFYSVLEFGFGSWLKAACERAEKFRKSHQEGNESPNVGCCTALLMDSDMRMRVADHHLDLFSRVLYLPVYAIVLIALGFS